MPEAEIRSFQTKLLTWYRQNARALPWRQNRDPYKIWVSETMLQQTQVQTVIPYYERWLTRFPTVEALAKAPLSEVLKHWAGLGYYRRARQLHQAAKILCRQPRKVPGSFSDPSQKRDPVPSEVSELIKLPGIGRYTAGAIASIAYGVRAPVLDGNVIRILTRIYGIRDDIGRSKTIQKLWDLAKVIVGATFMAPGCHIRHNTCRTRHAFGRELRPYNENNFHPGDFNQALMELGATLCFPRNPRCTACPVSRLCKAFKTGSPERFPIKKNREISESLRTAALIVRDNGKVLIRKQPTQARWGGLWMFPHWQDKKSMLSEIRCSKFDLKHRITVRHGFTKYRIALEVYEHRAKGKGQRGKIYPMPSALCALRTKWVHPSELQKFAFPSPHQKIVTEILTHV